MQCTSEYPCSHANVNLNSMVTFKNNFGKPIGFSDHTTEIGSALAAISLGATIIEKHFTLKKNFGIDENFLLLLKIWQKLKFSLKLFGNP